jgi:hypothetical protein
VVNNSEKDYVGQKKVNTGFKEPIMNHKFKLYQNGLIVGYMELQPLCCKTSNQLIWRYSQNGKTGWRGSGRDRIVFDKAVIIGMTGRDRRKDESK